MSFYYYYLGTKYISIEQTAARRDVGKRFTILRLRKQAVVVGRTRAEHIACLQKEVRRADAYVRIFVENRCQTPAALRKVQNIVCV